MAQPLLTIGMIVKNEERSLKKCLEALSPLRNAIPCELIIADTGSEDATKEIASQYADVIFDFKWVNDFSAARNAVIDKATGKWYLTIDADEYLSPDIRELVSFLTGPESKSKAVASVVQRNYKSAQLNGEYIDFNAVRMMKTETGNRYSGRIHEQFFVEDYKDIHILKSTILEHDGYIEITPGDTKRKQTRNLEILESMLKDEPQNIKYIMQCLESSSDNAEKRAYFSAYGMNVLKTAKNTAKYWETTGPACARQIALFLYTDESPQLSDWILWAEQNYKNSDFIKVDLQYIKLKQAFRLEDYDGIIKTAKEYIKNLTAYRKNVSNISTSFVSPMFYTAEEQESEASVMLSYGLINGKKENEAVNILKKLRADKLQLTSINLLFETIYLLSTKNAKTVLTSIFGSLYKNSEITINQDVYNLINENVTRAFSCSSKASHYQLYSDFEGTVGLSCKIATAKTKSEAEKYLSEIENWEQFMPLSLKQSLLLGVDLPKQFYFITVSQLTVLINELSLAAEEIADALLNIYCNEESFKEFSKLSFTFKLFLTVLLDEKSSLSNDLKLKFIEKFSLVAKEYLNYCYNADLLKEEENVLFLPLPHIFGWYMVKASELKNENPLEYVKALQNTVRRVPEAKGVIELLLNEMKNDEEKKRQEQIKNASPELVAMAEQLKVMLSAFSPDDPQLLAIKQSPLYKQVAFLIED